VVGIAGAAGVLEDAISTVVAGIPSSSDSDEIGPPPSRNFTRPTWSSFPFSRLSIRITRENSARVRPQTIKLLGDSSQAAK
jgi:hypothetical protein